MKIDFNSMETKILPNFKGGEGEFAVKMFTDSDGKIMRGTLSPGSSIGLHTHTSDAEIIYILSGVGKCLFDGGGETLSVGDCHYCPKGCEHSLINNGVENLEFFAVVR